MFGILHIIRLENDRTTFHHADGTQSTIDHAAATHGRTGSLYLEWKIHNAKPDKGYHAPITIQSTVRKPPGAKNFHKHLAYAPEAFQTHNPNMQSAIKTIMNITAQAGIPIDEACTDTAQTDTTDFEQLNKKSLRHK